MGIFWAFWMNSVIASKWSGFPKFTVSFFLSFSAAIHSFDALVLVNVRPALAKVLKWTLKATQILVANYWEENKGRNILHTILFCFFLSEKRKYVYCFIFRMTIWKGNLVFSRQKKDMAAEFNVLYLWFIPGFHSF